MQMAATIVPISTRDSGISAGHSVLVVDDDRPTRELLATILSEEGLSCHLSANGHEAMEQARQWPPSLVVLDVHLPSLQGEAVATALRIEHGPNLPILVMSASRELALADRIGAYGYLQKPFELDEFVLQIRRGIELLAHGADIRERSRLARMRLQDSLRRQQESFDRALPGG